MSTSVRNQFPNHVLENSTVSVVGQLDFGVEATMDLELTSIVQLKDQLKKVKHIGSNQLP